MTNANVWTYRDTLGGDVDTTHDLVGYDVEATDGSIGKIDELSNETSRHYMVVDTGFWIFGKKRLVPAGVVTAVDHTDQKVFVSMTKDEIKSAPDYRDMLRSDGDYGDYDRYYGDRSW